MLTETVLYCSPFAAVLSVFVFCSSFLVLGDLEWIPGSLFLEVRNRTCIKPGRETRHLKHLQNHGEQDRSTQCCVFSAAISFLASVSLFPTKYFSLILTGIWLTTRAIK